MPARNRRNEYDRQGRASLGLGPDRAVLDKLVRRFRNATQSEVARAAIRLGARLPNLLKDALEEVRDAR